MSSVAKLYRYTSARVIMEKYRSFNLTHHGSLADLRVHPGPVTTSSTTHLLVDYRSNTNAKHRKPPTQPTPAAPHTQATYVKHCDNNETITIVVIKVYNFAS